MSTGALRVRWARAHDDARITSMAFDLNFRRLITGCENGGVKVTLYCYASINIRQLWLQQAIDHYYLSTAIRITYCICCAIA